MALSEAPALRWAGGRLQTADGQEATKAQEQKARRYVKGGLIRHSGQGAGQVAGWGEPTWTEESYDLSPLAGCKMPLRVTVKCYYDGAGNLTGIDYRCPCQRAAGGPSRSPGGCSHALAVYLFRRDDTREA
jgi:hypothetical protein